MNVIRKAAPQHIELKEKQIHENAEFMKLGRLFKDLSYVAIEQCKKYPASKIHHLAKTQFGDEVANERKCMSVFVPFFAQLYNKKLYPKHGESEDDERTASQGFLDFLGGGNDAVNSDPFKMIGSLVGKIGIGAA